MKRFFAYKKTIKAHPEGISRRNANFCKLSCLSLFLPSSTQNGNSNSRRICKLCNCVCMHQEITRETNNRGRFKNASCIQWTDSRPSDTEEVELCSRRKGAPPQLALTNYIISIVNVLRRLSLIMFISFFTDCVGKGSL